MNPPYQDQASLNRAMMNLLLSRHQSVNISYLELVDDDSQQIHPSVNRSINQNVQSINRNVAPINTIIGYSLIERIAPDSFPVVCKYLSLTEKCLTMLHLSQSMRLLLTPSCCLTDQVMIHFNHSRDRSDEEILQRLINQSVYLPCARSVNIKNDAYDMFYSLPVNQRDDIINRMYLSARGSEIQRLTIEIGYRSFIPELPRLELIVAALNGLFDRDSPSNLRSLMIRCDAPISLMAFQEINWSGLSSCQSLTNVHLTFPRLDTQHMQESIDVILDSLPSSVRDLTLVTDVTPWCRHRRTINLDRFFRTQQLPYLKSFISNSYYTALDALGTRMELTNDVRPIRELNLVTLDINPNVFTCLQSVQHLTINLQGDDIQPIQLPLLGTTKMSSLVKFDLTIDERHGPHIYEPLLRYFFTCSLQHITLVFRHMSPWSFALMIDLSKVHTLRSLFVQQKSWGLGTSLTVDQHIPAHILPDDCWSHLTDMSILGVSCTLQQAESLIRASPSLQNLVIGCTAAAIPIIASHCSDIQKIELISDHQWPVTLEEMLVTMRSYPWDPTSFRSLRSLRFIQSFTGGVDRLFISFFNPNIPPAVANLLRWRTTSGIPLVIERH